MSSWFDRLLRPHQTTPARSSPSSVELGDTGIQPAWTPPAPFPFIQLPAVRDPKWERRYRRFLRTGVQPALEEFLKATLGAVALNQFNPEDYFPDELLAVGFGSAAAIGGEIGQVILFNPVGSPVLVVVESADVGVTVADFVAFSWGNTSLASPGQVALRDTRSGFPNTNGVPGQATIRSQHSAAGVGNGNLWGGGNLGVTVQPFTFNCVLVPGVGLSIQTTTAGARVLQVMFRWREIPLPSST